MCGRITQHRAKNTYLMEMGWRVDHAEELPGERAPNWNVPPGSYPWLMHRLGDGKTHIDRVNWSDWPPAANEKAIPIAISAWLEKATSGGFFRQLWKSGRAIVPADGWYEWTREQAYEQPWYIRLKTDRPMFMAAITNYRPGSEENQNTGFVIVTAAADGGLVDVYNRRPVVFSAEVATLWMDACLSPEHAERLARSMSLPASAFDWYPVSSEVNKTWSNGEKLIARIEK